MKKATLYAIVMTLLLCTAAAAGNWNLSALQAEATKAVPGGENLGSSQDDMGASVALTAEGINYQFTLAADTACQLPDARTVDYKGRTAFFFSVAPGSGGLMIVLDNDRSLTILCMAGFASDKDMKLGDMTAIADRMDLGEL